METRVAVVGIIVEKNDSAEMINEILHEYGRYIVGRMGIPYRERNICIISVVADAPQSVISAMTGKIGRVDGVNVKNYKFDTLYDKLGYVTQKAVLFAGSIRENVFFGESGAPETDEELSNAIALSQAEEFVNKLPDGTEHMISQMGRNVSGGQKQRLSIARALSRKPEILVFDDSFSALDYKTDAKLREGLNEKLKDTTKIIVAQRISTIRHADKIIVLDRGEAVGMGTHEELMKSCDVYKEIALSQLSAAELA